MNNIVNDASGNVAVGGTLTSSTITSATATALTIKSAGTTAMTIDTSQNVGIGTTAGVTTVNSGLAINNATAANYPGLEIQTAGVTRMYLNANNAASYIVSVSTNPLAFYTNGSERMRIDSSGNLLVGVTSWSDGSGGTLLNWTGGTSGVNAKFSSNSTASSVRVYFTNPNGAVGSIVTSGSATSFNPSSDARLKENITPIANGLERVSKLKPVDYHWKSDGLLDNGFIAQDLLAEPEFSIRVNPVGKADDGSDMYGVDYMKFVAVLTAAIQELSAKNDALEARLAALEAK